VNLIEATWIIFFLLCGFAGFAYGFETRGILFGVIGFFIAFVGSVTFSQLIRLLGFVGGKMFIGSSANHASRNSTDDDNNES
jgi:hypothetical protein